MELWERAKISTDYLATAKEGTKLYRVPYSRTYGVRAEDAQEVAVKRVTKTQIVVEEPRWVGSESKPEEVKLSRENGAVIGAKYTSFIYWPVVPHFEKEIKEARAARAAENDLKEAVISLETITKHVLRRDAKTKQAYADALKSFVKPYLDTINKQG